MEVKEVESKQLESPLDESSPVTVGKSTEIIIHENETPPKDAADESSVQNERASADESHNTDIQNERASGPVDNGDIAEEGEVVAQAANETSSRQVSSGSNIIPKEEMADDASERAGENATVAEGETAVADTGEAAQEAEPPTRETFEEGREQELNLSTGESAADDGRPNFEEESAKVHPAGSNSESSQVTGGKEEAEERALCIDYEKYKKELHELQSEKDRLSQINAQLQMKLVEYFRKKTGEDARPETEAAAVEHEQRYLKCLASMEDLKQEHKHSSALHAEQTEELRIQMQEKLNQADSEWKAFMALKKDVAVTTMSQRMGRQSALAEVEQVQASEQRKENELIQVRRENIKLRNMAQKIEALLMASTDMTGGLHLIDFEQLKIENQTYEEKIEERNEELVKLHRKVGRSVQSLTHVNAKLHLLQVENQAQKDQRADVDMVVNQKRDMLTRTKQVRDGIRADTPQLRQRCGLLGNETLLRDFEEKVGRSETMEERLEMLKRRHTELNLKCVAAKKKLEQGRQMAGNSHPF